MTDPSLEARLAEAQSAIERGDFAIARSTLVDATRAYPESAAAWKALGVAENKLGDADAARRALSESLRLDARDADAWSALGGVDVVTGRYDEALRSFERGLTSGPTTTYALLNYLTMAALVGDYDAAAERFAHALGGCEAQCAAQIAAGDNLPWCYFDLAQLYFFEGRHRAFRGPLSEALARSSPWQAHSARRSYELLEKSTRFSDAAADALAEFARHDDGF